MLKVYHHPDKPDVLRVVVYDEPFDEEPAEIMRNAVKYLGGKEW